MRTLLPDTLGRLSRSPGTWYEAKAFEPHPVAERRTLDESGGDFVQSLLIIGVRRREESAKMAGITGVTPSVRCNTDLSPDLRPRINRR
jgi:hypothetical protein